MTAKHSYVPFYKIIRTEQQSGNSFFYNKPFNRENSTVKNTMSWQWANNKFNFIDFRLRFLINLMWIDFLLVFYFTLCVALLSQSYLFSFGFSLWQSWQLKLYTSIWVVSCYFIVISLFRSCFDVLCRFNFPWKIHGRVEHQKLNWWIFWNGTICNFVNAWIEDNKLINWFYNDHKTNWKFYLNLKIY